MNPADARKDRGETDEDRCPDCWHPLDDCICGEFPSVLESAEQDRRLQRQADKFLAWKISQN